MPASTKEFLDIQTTIECGFTLKRACDIIRIYSKMHGIYLENAVKEKYFGLILNRKLF